MSTSSSFHRVVTFAALVGLAACSNMSDTQKKTFAGGAAGAAVGAAGAVLTGGCIPCATAIGGVVSSSVAYLSQKIEKEFQ
jgi:hypothetical protein